MPSHRPQRQRGCAGFAAQVARPRRLPRSPPLLLRFRPRRFPHRRHGHLSPAPRAPRTRAAPRRRPRAPAPAPRARGCGYRWCLRLARAAPWPCGSQSRAGTRSAARPGVHSAKSTPSARATCARPCSRASSTRRNHGQRPARSNHVLRPGHARKLRLGFLREDHVRAIPVEQPENARVPPRGVRRHLRLAFDDHDLAHPASAQAKGGGHPGYAGADDHDRARIACHDLTCACNNPTCHSKANRPRAYPGSASTRRRQRSRAAIPGFPGWQAAPERRETLLYHHRLQTMNAHFSRQQARHLLDPEALTAQRRKFRRRACSLRASQRLPSALLKWRKGALSKSQPPGPSTRSTSSPAAGWNQCQEKLETATANEPAAYGNASAAAWHSETAARPACAPPARAWATTHPRHAKRHRKRLQQPFRCKATAAAQVEPRPLQKTTQRQQPAVATDSRRNPGSQPSRSAAPDRYRTTGRR